MVRQDEMAHVALWFAKLIVQFPFFVYLFVCIDWFDSLCPIINFSVIKERVFLGWTSTKLGLMFLLKDTTQGTQRSDTSEARTRGPWVSSQSLYHWAHIVYLYIHILDNILSVNLKMCLSILKL